MCVCGKALLTGTDFAAVPRAMDTRCGVSAIQILTPSYFFLYRLRFRACLVFQVNYKDTDSFANKVMPFQSDRAS
jgi:hypothetical protein